MQSHRLFFSISFIIAISLFAIACSGDDVPANLIPIDKMKTITWDMMRAGELAQDLYAKDTITINQKTIMLYQQVFAVHGISKEDFYQSAKYYQAHPDLNEILVDSISAYSSRRRLELYKKLQ